MAENYGMKLVFKKPFADYFNENCADRDHRSLLSKMSALEVGVFITKTCLCNIQRYSSEEKFENFIRKSLIFFLFLLKT